MTKLNRLYDVILNTISVKTSNLKQFVTATAFVTQLNGENQKGAITFAAHCHSVNCQRALTVNNRDIREGRGR